MHNKHCRRNTVSGLLSEIFTKHVALGLPSDRPLYPCGCLRPWALFCGPQSLLNSAQPHAWSHWLNLREGGDCKEATSLYIWGKWERLLWEALPKLRAGQEYLLLAQFWAAGWSLADATLPPFFQGYRRDAGKAVLLWCDREYTSVDTRVINVPREQLVLIQFLIEVLSREELVMKAWKWCLLLWT